MITNNIEHFSSVKDNKEFERERQYYYLGTDGKVNGRMAMCSTFRGTEHLQFLMPSVGPLRLRASENQANSDLLKVVGRGSPKENPWFQTPTFREGQYCYSYFLTFAGHFLCPSILSRLLSIP